MARTLFGLAMLIAAIIVSIFLRARYKNAVQSVPIGLFNPLFLVIFGALALIGICIFSFADKAGTGILLVLIAVAFGALLCVKLNKKYGPETIKFGPIALFYGMGFWCGLLLRLTIIGIPLVRLIQTAGREGTQAAIDSMGGDGEDTGKTWRELFKSLDTSSAAQSPSSYTEERKVAEVYTEDDFGHVLESYPVNSDGTMYKKDGEWHKISDLKK